MAAEAEVSAMILDRDDASKTEVHPTAVVEDGAAHRRRREIGPFCHVAQRGELGEGVELMSHVVMAGRTTIGRAPHLPFASIGHQPQDLKYNGEPSTCAIGTDCLLREGVTMNPGTEGGAWRACRRPLRLPRQQRTSATIASRQQRDLSNNVMLAGHVTIGDFAGIRAAGRR